jgi:hypothetical protein
MGAFSQILPTHLGCLKMRLPNSLVVNGTGNPQVYAAVPIPAPSGPIGKNLQVLPVILSPRMSETDKN